MISSCLQGILSVGSLYGLARAGLLNRAQDEYKSNAMRVPMHPLQKSLPVAHRKIVFLDFDDTIFATSLLMDMIKAEAKKPFIENPILRKSLDKSEEILAKYLKAGFKVVLCSRGQVVDFLIHHSVTFRYRLLSTPKLPNDWQLTSDIEIMNSKALEASGESRISDTIKRICFQGAMDETFTSISYPGFLAVGDNPTADDLRNVLGVEALQKLYEDSCYVFKNESSFFVPPEYETDHLEEELNSRYDKAFRNTDLYISQFDSIYFHETMSANEKASREREQLQQPHLFV